MIRSLLKTSVVVLAIVVLASWAYEAYQRSQNPARSIGEHLRIAWNAVKPKAHDVALRLKAGGAQAATAVLKKEQGSAEDTDALVTSGPVQTVSPGVDVAVPDVESVVNDTTSHVSEITEQTPSTSGKPDVASLMTGLAETRKVLAR